MQPTSHVCVWPAACLVHSFLSLPFNESPPCIRHTCGNGCRGERREWPHIDQAKPWRQIRLQLQSAFWVPEQHTFPTFQLPSHVPSFIVPFFFCNFVSWNTPKPCMLRANHFRCVTIVSASNDHMDPVWLYSDLEVCTENTLSSTYIR